MDVLLQVVQNVATTNTYLNNVKSTLRECDIGCTRLEELASQRNNWRATVKAGIARAEEDRIERLILKRMRRKGRAGLSQLPT